MGKRSLLLRCITCGLVPLCWSAVVLERVEADGGKDAHESESPAARVASSRTHAFNHWSPHQQMGQQQQHQQHAQEQSRQPDVTSAISSVQIPLTSGDCPSFVQSRINADVDVSCIPHSGDVGSTANSKKVVYEDSIVKCLKQCRAMKDCTHYTYNPQSRACHLKVDAPNFYAYPGDITVPRSCDTSCFVGCLTYNTSPMKTLTYANRPPALCQSACMSTPGCLAFVYEDPHCKLFGKGFSAYRSVGGGNTVAGPMTDCSDPSDLRLTELRDGSEVGSCLKSDNIASATSHLIEPPMVPDVSACQKQCESNNRCTHFTYSTRTKLCWMKAGTPDYRLGIFDITGSRDCVPT